MRIALKLELYVVLYFFISLQACSVSSGKRVDVYESDSSLVVGYAEELDSLIEGDSVVLHSGLLAPLGQVTIGRQYYAASGRLCKQILDEAGDEIMSVACRADEGHWYLREFS